MGACLCLFFFLGLVGTGKERKREKEREKKRVKKKIICIFRISNLLPLPFFISTFLSSRLSIFSISTLMDVVLLLKQALAHVLVERSVPPTPLLKNLISKVRTTSNFKKAEIFEIRLPRCDRPPSVAALSLSFFFFFFSRASLPFLFSAALPGLSSPPPCTFKESPTQTSLPPKTLKKNPNANQKKKKKKNQGLGYGVVAGASVVKLPQLLKLASAGSAAGLSPLSAELEQAAYGVGAAYGIAHGLPFSAFGETCFLALQNLAILALVYRFNGTPARGALAALVAALAAAAFFGGKISRKQVAAAYEGASLLVLAARVPQIYSNFKAKATGQLSGITCGANALGALARVFTSMSAGESGRAMARSYALGAALNSVILAQIVLYGKGKRKGGGASRRRKGTPQRRAVAAAAPAAAAAAVSSPSREAKRSTAAAAAASPAAASAPATRRTPARKSKK